MTTDRSPQSLGFDPYTPEFQADPYHYYRQLRSRGSAHRTPGGAWLVGSLAHGTGVLRDRRFGHGARRARSFLVLDPPEHTRLRRLVSTAFTPRLVEGLRPRVTALVEDLLGRMDEDVDLLTALARPLSLNVISDILGVPPADRSRLGRWARAFSPGLDPSSMPAEKAGEYTIARQRLAEYFRRLIAWRRSCPGEDLLSTLATGGDLSGPELLETSMLLFGAGYETTVDLIANGMLALLRAPDQLRWFRDHPEEAPAVVEELLRYDPPFQFVRRVALEDAEIGGHLIRRGEPVGVAIGAANRDPDAFTEPDLLDVTRWGTREGTHGRHLAFGYGIHFCLGASLARLEAQTALAELVQREITLAPVPLRYHDNVVLRGLTRLPVRIGR